MPRRPSPPTPSPAAPAPDPWLPLVRAGGRAARSVARPPAPPPLGEGAVLGVARADAARRAARRLVDARGRPVRVLATVEAAGEVTVHLGAPAAPPPGWRAAGSTLVVPASLDTAALVTAVPDELDDPGPALVELRGPAGAAAVDVVAVGVLGVAAGAATVGVVRALLVGLLGAPAATGLDVLVASVHPACLPAVAPHAPGRLHAPVDADSLVPLAHALAGAEEAVVVVAPADALPWDDVALLRAAGVGAVLLSGAPTTWHLDAPDGADGPLVLRPLGLAVRPAAG